ncbi:lytic transglycosylase domain-containing protein [Paenibacillus sp. CGMCC 1.16610]|uniref:Transglycosylase SLT domain-containing protein n=1 Tax=Paenibacillus anseongense TaxID=2682845 RepID=A0ABW9UAN0_9BACL|nr:MULTISPECIES: lytic transglycosylase domain-containing protein [Paenibacillus]MBA2938117.1 lytic transglycosylase domain-containing protein [Paenibacillus sp. CGMCC 1.16610]MVQ37174.1 transglycosylase SLT domain-containing protein [Paenibacillus anseongense]
MNGTNSIDPRVLKELLQLQVMGRINLLSGDTDTSNTDDSSDFSTLLNTLMGQASGSGLDGQSNLNPMTANNIPSSLGALNKAYSPLQSWSRTTSTSQFDDLIKEASAKYGVDESLVKAVIQQESDFNHQAVSPAGAKGLMQLMDGTGRGYGVTNPFDPKQNVDAGTHFLSNLIQKYNGNEGVALAAYNAGPGRVDRLGIKNDQDLSNKLHQLPKETQAYVSQVLGHKMKFSL